MTALEKLIEAVEAEAPSIHDIAVEALGPMLWKMVRDAYEGSLDAAKRLHEALLPAWMWKLGPSNAMVFPFNASPHDAKYYGMSDNPARAWLLAILRALAAKGDA